MRHNFIYLAVLLFASVFSQVQAADWAIDVVPENSRNNGQSIHIAHPFFVVLSNTTDHDLTIWKEWCSCGYFNLSFDFSGKDGKVTHVKKRNQYWTRNFPDPFIVGPGKRYVLEVDFKPDTWEGTEGLYGPMLLQAIYENTNSHKPIGGPAVPSAWLGRAVSESIQVTVERNSVPQH
jgi:hypothetical protein